MELVSLSRKVHVPIEAPDAPTYLAKPTEVEIDQDVAMVNRRKMTVDWFIPNAQALAQPQGGDHVPPPPTTSHPKKK